MRGKMSKPSWYRSKERVNQFFGQLSEIQQCDVAVKSLLDPSWQKEKLGCELSLEKSSEFLKKRFSNFSDFILKRRVAELKSIVTSAKEPELLLHSLVLGLLQRPVQGALLQEAGLLLADSLLGREQMAVAVSKRLALEHVTRRQGGADYRTVALDHALAVVQEAGLSKDKFKDTSILALAIRSVRGWTNMLMIHRVRSTWHFARKLLDAVHSGTVDSLRTRKLQHGAIKGTDWPQILRRWVLLPEQSRETPGLETVSVGRNLPRVPKRILSRDKSRTVAEFLTSHPHCPFKR